MKFSDIVILSSTRNEKIEEFQIQMMDSFIENTPEECKLFIIENNSEETDHSRWKDYVKSKKQNFVYSKTEFNINKLYNEGTLATKNEYIMYANNDLLFYPDWYYNLLNWFDDITGLFVVSPFTKTYDWEDISWGAYRKDVSLQKFFCDTIHIPGWFYCLKRESGYEWDENFRAHYQDNDFVYTLEKMKNNDSNIKSGIAYNSRIDHMGGKTWRFTQSDYFYSDGKEKMIKKWGKC